MLHQLHPLHAAIQATFDINFAAGENPVTKYGFAFTRATSATYVNASGLIATAASGELRYTYDPVTLSALGVLIEEARTNLCLYSDALDNAAWTLGNMLTFGSGSAANATTSPDGTSSAEKLTPSTSVGSARVTQSITVSAVAHTFSFYAKPNGYKKVGFRENTFTGKYATWDLSGSGTLIDTNATSTSVMAVGEGWYRCSVTFTESAGSMVHAIYIMDDSYSTGPPNTYTYAGNGTYGAYIWGAQIEAGAFPTSYIPTTGTAATRNADVLSLTGAVGRTNLLSYSQNLSLSPWGVTGTATVSAADTANFPSDDASQVRQIVSTAAISAGASSTVSALLSGTGTIKLNIERDGAGTYETSASTITLTATPTWYSLTRTWTSSQTGQRVFLSRSGTTATTVTVGGFQLETGSSATAYIPTTNGPRTVENLASWFNGDAGTFVAQARSNVPTSVATTTGLLSIGQSGTERFNVSKGTAGAFYLIVQSQGANQAFLGTATDVGIGSYSHAAAYAVDDGIGALNGTLGSADTAMKLPSGIANVALGSFHGAGTFWNGTISRIRYYNRRLPNATLQSLTT